MVYMQKCITKRTSETFCRLKIKFLSQCVCFLFTLFCLLWSFCIYAYLYNLQVKNSLAICEYIAKKYCVPARTCEIAYKCVCLCGGRTESDQYRPQYINHHHRARIHTSFSIKKTLFVYTRYRK